MNDTTHTHPIIDPTHGHTYVDYGHNHTFSSGGDTITAGTGGLGGGSSFKYASPTTTVSTVGITISNAATGITTAAQWTGITSGTATNTGAGAGQNLQPTLLCNKIIFAGA